MLAFVIEKCSLEGVAVFDIAEFREGLRDPSMVALDKDGLEMALEEGACVSEVLFGVGFGGGEALKRFVEQADDPLLFGERGDDELQVLEKAVMPRIAERHNVKRL